MMTRKSMKHALLMSALSLLLCVSMLVGTTYAWFTDSVTSAGNKIKSGTLDVRLLMHDGTDYVDISESADPIFGSENSTAAQNNNADTLWEPGKTQVAYLAIKNNGNLALKYKVALDVNNEAKDLYKVMQYAIVPDAQPTSGAVTEWPSASANTVSDGVNLVSAAEVELPVETTHYFALAIHMMENAGNEYQEGKVSFDLRILATQLDAELDSFDSKYDENAAFPAGKDTTISDSSIDLAPSLTVPAEAPEGEYKLVIDDTKTKITNEDGEVTVEFDMTLTRDGVEVTNSGIEWPVTLKLPHPFVEVTGVTHNGEKITDFTVDTVKQTISFTTTHFSPFTIEYTDYIDPSFENVYKVDESGTITITKGMFVGKNPAEYDKTLANADSELKVTEFEKNSKKYYVVSEKATTVVVEPTQPNQLASIIAGLSSNAHSTVLLKPGTYEEATTISVTSSMDIIGLGDAEDVKVKKIGAVSTTTVKPSNRHLFNCTNSNPSTYIQVTIRNLYLDATEKNSYIGSSGIYAGKTQYEDNAAVQSIRRAKVKCYDLEIVKDASDMSSIAFYVNSNNKASDGKTYPAYMYAENVVINSAKSVSVVDASGTGKSYFYYNNVSYADGASQYTNSTSYIKNTTMAAKDWTW